MTLPHIRTFIAVELPTKCIECIKTLQSQLKTIAPDVKWVKPSDCHITLKFLGNVPTGTIVPIIQHIEASLKGMSAFSIETTKIDAFPSLRRPEVLWIGIRDDQKRLDQLAGIIDAALIPLGVPKENRAFSAHITFARIRSNKNRSLSDSLSSIRMQPVLIPIKHVILYQSILSSRGPEYTPLHRWSLK